MKAFVFKNNLTDHKTYSKTISKACTELNLNAKSIRNKFSNCNNNKVLHKEYTITRITLL